MLLVLMRSNLAGFESRHVNLSCMRAIDVFNTQACDTCIMRVNWQV